MMRERNLEISHRGTPFYNDVIHLKVDRSTNGGCRAAQETACNTGAYHVRWTQDKKLVDCPECRKRC